MSRLTPTTFCGVPSSPRTIRPRSVIQTTDLSGLTARYSHSILPRRLGQLDRRLHPLHVLRVESPEDSQFGTEGAGGKAEQRLGIGRPLHLVGREIPVPRRDLGHLHRQPEPFLALDRAAVSDRQRRGALRDPQLQLLVCFLQGFLRPLPLRDLVLERVVQGRERPRLAEQFDEHRDFRSQDVRVHGLAQVIDGADAVAPQHVFVVEQVGGEEQDGNVLTALALFDQMGEVDPADPRHPDVEDDRGKVLPQHREQRFVSRLRAHDPAARTLEHRLERVEIARLVVDDQQRDVFVVHDRVGA